MQPNPFNKLTGNSKASKPKATPQPTPTQPKAQVVEQPKPKTQPKEEPKVQPETKSKPEETKTNPPTVDSPRKDNKATSQPQPEKGKNNDNKSKSNAKDTSPQKTDTKSNTKGGKSSQPEPKVDNSKKQQPVVEEKLSREPAKRLDTFLTIAKHLEQKAQSKSSPSADYLADLLYLLQQDKHPVAFLLDSKANVEALTKLIETVNKSDPTHAQLVQVAHSALTLFDFDRSLVPHLRALMSKIENGEWAYQKPSSPNSNFVKALKFIQRLQEELKTLNKTNPNKSEIIPLVTEGYQVLGWINEDKISKLENLAIKNLRERLSQELEKLAPLLAKPDQLLHQRPHTHNAKYVPVQKRTHFLLHEKLDEEESDVIEYKDWSWPMTVMTKDALKKSISSFLNTSGGRLYIGVSEERKVVGTKVFDSAVNSELCVESIQRDIIELLDSFYPRSAKENVDFAFVPIVHDKETVRDRCVLKLIIRPVDPSEVISSDKKTQKSYWRFSGKSTQIPPDCLEAKAVLAKLGKTDLIAAQRKSDPTNFKDPNPEKLAYSTKQQLSKPADEEKKIEKRESGNDQKKSDRPKTQGDRRRRDDKEEKKEGENGDQNGEKKERKPREPREPREPRPPREKKEKNEKKEVRVFTKIPREKTAEELDKFLASLNITPLSKKMLEVKGQTTGSCFLGFETKEGAEEFIQKANGSEFWEKFKVLAEFTKEKDSKDNKDNKETKDNKDSK